MIGAVLEPLAARYGYWLSLDDAGVERDREEATEDVRAMQLVVRMERDAPPAWHTALAFAASGAAAICLDPRSEPGGEWHEQVSGYLSGHIRKVTRRARGAQWEAVQELPGLGYADDATQVRVLVPGRATELDRRVSRLQVGGTDIEPDDTEPIRDARLAGRSAGGPGGPGSAGTELAVWLPASPAMTLGKAMAQVGHAGMIAAALLAGADQSTLARWLAAGLPAVVHVASAGLWTNLREELENPRLAWESSRLLAVRDAGFTEVAPGTVTAIGEVGRRW